LQVRIRLNWHGEIWAIGCIDKSDCTGPLLELCHEFEQDFRCGLLYRSGIAEVDQNARSRLAVCCAALAASSFSMGDAIVRMLSDTLPLHQIVLMRSLVSIPLTLTILVPLEGGLRMLRTKRPMWHLWRAVALTVASISFFSAIASVPLAQATAVFFTAPLMITALSAFLLKERVNCRRWMALAAGLVGVVLVVRPGASEFQWTLLLPLVAAAAYAVLNTMTRSVGTDEPACAMTFYIQLTFLATGCVIGLAIGDGRLAGSDNPSIEFLLRAWVWPGQGDLLLIAATGACNFSGAYLISQAYRFGESGLVAPFEYIAVVTAGLYGYLFWKEVPDVLALTGTFLIVGAGIFIATREARLDFGETIRRILFGPRQP